MVLVPATGERGGMATLHIENTVHDYDDWKAVFDKFDQQRRSRGVRSYRVVRGHDDPHQVIVDLEFDSTTRAEEFREFLRGVFATPQSQAQLAEHRPPTIFEVVDEQVFGTAAAKAPDLITSQPRVAGFRHARCARGSTSGGGG